MKDDKKFKEMSADPESILNTNSAKMAEEQPQEKQKAKPKLKSVLAALLVVVLLVGVFVGGGVLSEAQYQAELKREEARALRTDAMKRYIDAPEKVEGSVESGVTTLYYSQENGMWLEVTVVNGMDSDIKIRTIAAVVKNGEDAVIASGSSKIKKCSAVAGETEKITVYFPPEYVKITDDKLEEVSLELTVEHEVEK